MSPSSRFRSTAGAACAQLGVPAVEREGADVRRRPVGQGLGPCRLGEGVARGAEHGHEDLRLPHLAGLAVDHRHRLPGVLDEQLLAGAVLLPHHQVELRGPGPVLLAEPALCRFRDYAESVRRTILKWLLGKALRQLIGSQDSA